MEDKEIQITKKQKIVAGIIALVTLILLVSVFGGKKAEEKTAPSVAVKVEEKMPIKEEAEVQKPSEQQPEVKEAVEAEAVEPATEETEVEEKVVEEEVDEGKIPEATKEVIKVEPKNSVLTFEATTEKALNYQVFYTVEREVWYDAEHVVDHQGEAGTHKYSIVIPSDKVFRIRIDFDANPGKVIIKNIYLDGTQKADLNNFDGYAYNQIDAKDKNKDGSLTITSQQDDPYMEYLTPLLPE